MTVTNQHIETAGAVFRLINRTEPDLVRLRDHFKAIAHLARHPLNRRDSEALIAACQYELDRRAGKLGCARFSYDGTTLPSHQSATQGE